MHYPRALGNHERGALPEVRTAKAIDVRVFGMEMRNGTTSKDEIAKGKNEERSRERQGHSLGMLAFSAR